MLEGIEAKVLRKVQMASSRVDVGAEIKEYEIAPNAKLRFFRTFTKRRLRSCVREDELAPAYQDGQGLHRHEA